MIEFYRCHFRDALRSSIYGIYLPSEFCCYQGLFAIILEAVAGILFSMIFSLEFLYYMVVIRTHIVDSKVSAVANANQSRKDSYESVACIPSFPTILNSAHSLNRRFYLHRA